MGLAEAKCFMLPDMDPLPLKTEDDLKEWAEKQSGYVTTCYHQKFIEWAFAVRVPDNPESVAQGKDALITSFQMMLEAYRVGSDRKPLFWRSMPKIGSWKGEIVEYRDDGPDIEATTDRRCVKDYSHIYINIYARFRADDDPPGAQMFIGENAEVPWGWKVVEHIKHDQAKLCVKMDAPEQRAA